MSGGMGAAGYNLLRKVRADTRFIFGAGASPHGNLPRRFREFIF